MKLTDADAQSLELMPGTQRTFTDIQWIKAFDDQGKWTIFSRSRATVDYDNETNLFTGAFISYTTATGFGVSAVGRISSSGGATDMGIHYVILRDNLTLFAIVSTQFFDDPNASWFSILRYRPVLNDQWKLYTSLELFSRFESEGHVFSVQRIRSGLDRNGFQFGFGINLLQDADFSIDDANPGLFVRREF